MNQAELRNYVSKYMECRTISDCCDLLDIYIEFLLITCNNHQEESVNSIADIDAKIIGQMMMTKALHLKNAITGISFQTKHGLRLNKIIDPTIVASLVRNIYETTGMFNLIYRFSKNSEEKNIIHLLWVISGLKYRQRFESNITKKVNQQKFEHEKAEIDRLISIIEASDLYNKLDEKNQGRIQKMIKDKTYLVEFENLEVKVLHWHDLTRTMGMKEGLLDNIYTNFSLYAHPSNVAVFQFSDMFIKGEEAFLELTNFNLKLAFFMFSVFIADYIKLFPAVLKTFNSMDVCDQIAINLHNVLARNYDFSINETWKLLG